MISHEIAATELVETIIRDMCGRSGGDWMDGLDPDIQNEIRDTWIGFVQVRLAERGVLEVLKGIRAFTAMENGLSDIMDLREKDRVVEIDHDDAKEMYDIACNAIERAKEHLTPKEKTGGKD